MAVTAAGGRIPVTEVIRHASKARIIDIVTDEVGNPLYYGHTRRLASIAQRHALCVRDRGCVIPGCTVPATRTEAHHLNDWALGGPTDIDKLALLCATTTTTSTAGHCSCETAGSGAPHHPGSTQHKHQDSTPTSTTRHSSTNSNERRWGRREAPLPQKPT